MARLQADEGEDRTNVALDRGARVVVQAVIAMEDRDFYEHDGVNPTGIARAMFQNVKGGSASQGGSTITQQYVKNAFELSTERAISRKVKEAVLSVKLEQQMSKDEILEGYLNTIYFGRGAYGVAAASRGVLRHGRRTIGDPGEAALLAGLIRAPATAEPTKHPEEATRRRHTASWRMEEEGYINRRAGRRGRRHPVAEPWFMPFSTRPAGRPIRRGGGDRRLHGHRLPPAVHPRASCKRIDPVRFTEDTIDRGGLRIYTSLNYDIQRRRGRR